MSKAAEDQYQNPNQVGIHSNTKKALILSVFHCATLQEIFPCKCWPLVVRTNYFKKLSFQWKQNIHILMGVEGRRETHSQNFFSLAIPRTFSFLYKISYSFWKLQIMFTSTSERDLFPLIKVQLFLKFSLPYTFISWILKTIFIIWPVISVLPTVLN